MLHSNELLAAEVGYRREHLRAVYRPVTSAERYGRRRRGHRHRRPAK